jgi:hypothetical protein
VPGTQEGLPAIEELIFAGIPINVTLLFSREHYLAAAEAYEIEKLTLPFCRVAGQILLKTNWILELRALELLALELWSLELWT